MKKIKATFDTKKIKLTRKYQAALKNLLIEELKLMRKIHGIKYWHCGSVKINDLCNSRHLEFQYGCISDVERIKSEGDIFVRMISNNIPLFD